MSRPAALGFDVGTTSVKAGLLWLDSDEPMAVASRAYPSLHPQPGWVDQDPREWLDAMAACWTELAASAGRVELRSIGICSQVNTHLVVDAHLEPLRPAITWQDTRAADEAAELDAAADARRVELWGGPFRVDASFALARLLWLSRHEPRHRAAARWLLQPKDYCVAVLTGQVATDAISPVGLTGPGGGYLDGVLELVAGASDLVPPLRDLDVEAGRTRDANPAGLPGGVPIAVGTMDAWASIFGAGLLRSGRGMDLAGTSEVVVVASPRTLPTAGVVSFAPWHGIHVQAAPTQAGGAALAWAARSFGLTIAEALALAEEARRDPQAIVFLPHLAGERAPYWNPDARGAFLGLTTSTAPRHLILAVLEGVAYSVRMLLAACERAAGLEVVRLRACGGGARSLAWNQIKSSAVGRPVDVLEAIDAGVLGAVLTGIVAAGLADNVAALAEERVRIATSIEPQPAAAARLDELYSVYAEGYRALEPLFARLAASRG